MSLDFPHAQAVKDKVPNPARNNELQNQYNVQGFPTVLLMTADGEVFAQTGYKGMTPENYLADVRDLRARGKKGLEALRLLGPELEKAKDRVAVVRRAVTALNAAGEGVPAGEGLAEIVRNGLALDPENKSGLKLECLKALVLTGNAARGEMDLALEMDPKNELGMLEAVAAKEYELIDSDEAKAAFMDHAQRLFDSGKVHKAAKAGMVFAVAAIYTNQSADGAEKAKVFARKALDLGSLMDQVVPMLKKILGEV